MFARVRGGIVLPGFDLHYHMEGDGTSDSPAVLTFTFTGLADRDLEVLRGQLPSSVTLEKNAPGSFEMRAVDPSMSRSDLFRVFDTFTRGNHWTGKHQA
jgi:hypothetical protein